MLCVSAYDLFRCCIESGWEHRQRTKNACGFRRPSRVAAIEGSLHIDVDAFRADVFEPATLVLQLHSVVNRIQISSDREQAAGSAQRQWQVSAELTDLFRFLFGAGCDLQQ